MGRISNIFPDVGLIRSSRRCRANPSDEKSFRGWRILKSHIWGRLLILKNLGASAETLTFYIKPVLPTYRGYRGEYPLTDLLSHHSKCAKSVGENSPTYGFRHQGFPRCRRWFDQRSVADLTQVIRSHPGVSTPICGVQYNFPLPNLAESRVYSFLQKRIEY
jgi:hypothetical protein